MLIVIIALHGLIGCALPNRQPILVVPRLCAYARHQWVARFAAGREARGFDGAHVTPKKSHPRKKDG
jgi:hypothetical protein